MSLTKSTASTKSSDGVPEQFPAGLRVLIVDGDPTYLRILEKMLRNCRYEVTKCSRGEVALKLLEENRDGFDIVMSDLQMSDMDGFKFLEQIGLEMELPVIMISADNSKDVVMKGVAHGASDYLIKPVRMEALKNIWQHVIRGRVGDGERQQKAGVWSVELHQQFVAAVNQIGIIKAVPKRIMDMMNVPPPGLSREAIARHLQKYRPYFRRLSELDAPPRPITFI